jgi:hypothetical protein
VTSEHHACIFVPADLPLEAIDIAPLLAYCDRRGYRLHAIFRDWAYVDWVLAVGQASVVVTMSTIAAYRAGEPVPDPDNTRALRQAWRQHNVHRGVSAPRLSPSQVRELVDGNGRMPAGLDPATVAAARRIARRLNGAWE